MVKPFRGLQAAVVVVFFLMIWLGLAGSAGAAVPCNDDRGCDSLSLCLNGVCQTSLGQPCNDTAGCLRGGRNLTCSNGVCTPFVPQCTQDSQCGAGRLCIDGQCLAGFCRNNTQCGDRQVCGSDSRCRTVQCTTASHCAADQYCNPNTNMCVARCPSGQAFVRSNTQPVCSACVDPRAPHFRPIAQGGCPLGMIAADGFCIADCRPKPPAKLGPKDPAGIGIVPGNLPPAPQPAPGTVPGR
jgi:Cys-rich repeat protein